MRRTWLRSDSMARLAVAIVSLIAAGAAFAPVRSPASPRLAASPPPTRAPATVAPTPEPTPVPAFRPERIEIPALGVSAPIVPVGIDPDGAMGTPKSAHEVAWWDGMPPGLGNALLAGHKDWNRKPGSFYRLPELKGGEIVRVLGEGRQLDFRVEWTRQVPADAGAEEILGEVGRPVVTLITCGGQFDRRIRHYQDRVVVRAALV